MLDVSRIKMKGMYKEDENDADSVEGLLKKGLKKLTTLKVDNESVRLGTDWKGYP
jgi:hypothetical protein